MCVCVKLTCVCMCVRACVCKVDPYLVICLVISDLLNEALTVPISLLYGVIYNRTLDYHHSNNCVPSHSMYVVLSCTWLPAIA